MTDTVVSKVTPPSEQEFHALMVAGLARAAVNLGGQGALADKMDMTSAGLKKIFNGGMTSPKRLFDMLLDDRTSTVLDDIAARYGRRFVDKEAVCNTDDAGLLLARLLVWVQEAQHPDSPGGRNIVHTELAPVEAQMRELHGALGNWISQIDEVRKPRAVA